MVALSFRGLCAISFLALVQAKIIGFDSFIETYARTYTNGSSEFKMRRALYEKRKAESELHNSNPNRMWTAGVNKLWDWTEPELKTLRGWDGSAMPAGGSHRSVRKHTQFLQQQSELPQEKIWSNLATAHRVRNQGDCGSCWAIAAASVLEAHVEIYTNKPRTFSAQQIVECTPNPRHCGGDGGCQGATAELAMDWVLKNGCAEETSVPYSASDAACEASPPSFAQVSKKQVPGDHFDDMSQLFGESTGNPAEFAISGDSFGRDWEKSLNLNSQDASIQRQIFSDNTVSPAQPAAKGGAAFGMTGWETLPKNEFEPLKRALAERGPVAVSVAADQWYNYDSGIFNSCGKDAIIDHAVVAMGYGQEGSNKFWLIQNSWGDAWGEQGHIRLLRNDENDNCGMNNDPQKGVACQGETAPVPVCGQCGVLFDSVVPHFDSGR